MAIKVPCRVATTANITLSGAQTIDGVAVVTDDRVLVKNQTDTTENGIYVADTGDWSRSPDCDGANDLVFGSLVKVNLGTVGPGFYYVSTTGDIVVGTDAVAFTLASSVLAVVSAFMQTVFDDTTAGAARTTLGAAGIAGDTFTGDVAISRSSSGGTVIGTVGNTSNTAASDAKLELAVAGALGGDPFLRWLITGVKSWSMGIDNSDTDALVISEDGVIGTGNRFKIAAGGVVSIPGQLDLSGASAGQISFPATQNPSAGANVLDDYKEGTFSPSVGGSATYTTQAGFYTKIGREFIYKARLTINAIGTGSTGVISGLPGTAATVAAISVGYFTGSATNYTTIKGFVNAGASTINLVSTAAAVASVTNPATFFANAADIMFGGTFHV